MHHKIHPSIHFLPFICRQVTVAAGQRKQFRHSSPQHCFPLWGDLEVFPSQIEIYNPSRVFWVYLPVGRAWKTSKRRWCLNHMSTTFRLPMSELLSLPTLRVLCLEQSHYSNLYILITCHLYDATKVIGQAGSPLA